MRNYIVTVTEKPRVTATLSPHLSYTAYGKYMGTVALRVEDLINVDSSGGELNRYILVYNEATQTWIIRAMTAEDLPLILDGGTY